MPNNPAATASESIASLVDRVNTLEDALYTGTQPQTASHSLVAIPTSHAASSPHRQLGNPSPLGLLGFALVSFIAGTLKLARPARADPLLGAIAFFIGGVAQLVAAVFQVLLNNTHSATAFGLFSFHWMSQGFLIFVRMFDLDMDMLELPAEQRRVTAATYYSLLTVVAGVLWVPTFRMNFFLNLTLLFIMLVFALDVPAVYGSRAAEMASGVFSCIAATLALYMALLDLVNETWKRPVLPLFPHKAHKDDYNLDLGLPYIPKRTFHKSAVSSAHL